VTAVCSGTRHKAAGDDLQVSPYNVKYKASEKPGQARTADHRARQTSFFFSRRLGLSRRDWPDIESKASFQRIYIRVFLSLIKWFRLCFVERRLMAWTIRRLEVGIARKGPGSRRCLLAGRWRLAGSWPFQFRLYI